MDHQARLSRVIGSLYDAAAEPGRWPETLTLIADLLGSVGAQLCLWNRCRNTTQLSVVGRLPEEGNEAYLRYYGAIDTRRRAIERVPAGEVMACGLDFDEGRFCKGEFFNDFLIPHDVPYVAGIKPFETAEQSAVIAVLRSFRQGPFGQEELATLGRLAPHMRRAVSLHLRMRELTLREEAVEAVFDRLPLGIVIADEDGRVLVINRAAEDLAAASDGLLLRNGHLTAGGAREASELARHVKEAVRTASGRQDEGGAALRISRPSGRRPFALLIAPLGPDGPLAAGRRLPAALILISDLEGQPRVLGRWLVGLFGLTQAEASLATALVAGKRLEDIAEARRVRMPTLRTQLHAILDKTGTHGQSELMRLMAGLPSIRMR